MNFKAMTNAERQALWRVRHPDAAKSAKLTYDILHNNRRHYTSKTITDQAEKIAAMRAADELARLLRK